MELKGSVRLLDHLKSKHPTNPDEELNTVELLNEDDIWFIGNKIDLKNERQ